jgi:hypothetical protein
MSALGAFALNENAEAVGYWACGNDGYMAWSLSGATDSSTAYFDDESEFSYAEGVNNHNVAVGCYGSCGDSPGSWPAIFEPSSSPEGRVIKLRGLKGRACGDAVATSINDSGEVVGIDCSKAVRYSLSGFAQPLPVGNNSAAEAINKRGDVVGFSANSAFLYHLGKTLELPKPPGDAGYAAIAWAINASDEIVGSLYKGGSTYSAFVYLNGRSYDLNTLIPPHSGWTIVDAYGVNDHGEIVGDGIYNGNLYGISLKPPV